jgi:hypothetical protein
MEPSEFEMNSVYFGKFTIVFVGIYQDPATLDFHFVVEESRRACASSIENQTSSKLAKR